MIKLYKNLCVLAALFMSSAAIAGDSGWVISEVNGQVSVIRDSKAIYGAQGTRLEVGDVVKTSGGARAVLARGEKFFVVAPKSRVRIKPVQKQGKIAQMFEYLGDQLMGGNSRGDKQVLAAVVKGYGDKPEEVELKGVDGSMNALNPSD
ncbi:MAG: hypothetical protein ABJP34_08175 [Erythrobacter sp.]